MKCYLTGMAFLLAVILTLHGADPKSTSAPANVAGLLSDDAAVRQQTEEQLTAWRSATVTDAIGIVGNVRNRIHRPSSVASAMRVLGSMRAPEARGALAANIGFGGVGERDPDTGAYADPQSVGGGVPIEKRLPAVGALLSIGEVAVPDVMKKAAEADDLVEQDACAYVLSILLGNARALEAGKAALASEPDSRKRTRLETVLRNIESRGQAVSSRPTRR